MITAEDIRNTVDKLDEIRRPLIAILNPEDAKLLKDDYPDIEEGVVIRESAEIESGKCICMERKIWIELCYD